MRHFCLAASFVITSVGAAAALEPREGWFVADSDKGYTTLLADLHDAVKAEKMGVVTEAGPTEAAADRGVIIPGNRVVGVFRNDFAARALAVSETAMIEAPIRFYVLERSEGGSTLAYKLPGRVFAPYFTEGGTELANIADELDKVFAAISVRALE